jgi:hypothetical protein
MVRTPASQAGNAGSNPARGEKKSKIQNLKSKIDLKSKIWENLKFEDG